MQLSYWKEQLNVVSLLELPTDRPRSSVKTFCGSVHAVKFPARVTEALRNVGLKEEASLFTILLAAFQVLLHRYTGQDDIAVGTPIPNRSRAEIEGSVDFFVNTLVMRTDTSGDPAFRELLKKVRKVTLDAYTHQDLPFEKLVEELHPERDLSHNPVFQVMFSLQNMPYFVPALSRLTLSKKMIEDTMMRSDLGVYLRETEEGLKGEFVYNTDLFDAATIERMAGHYQRILEGIADDPDQRLSELPLLTDSERHQLLVEWNDTTTDYPRDKCIHELFEEQVKRVPDNIAVVFKNKKITYRELNERANQLARRLRSEGVTAGVIVGIMVHRSIDMISGLLGVLKAGGAYLPIDPEYPDSRIEYMLKDSDARVLLTQESLMNRLAYNGQRIILDRTSLIEEDTSDLDVIGSSRCLAYVIYTSGSTGIPKGVMVEHRSVVNLCTWFNGEYELAKNRNVIQSTTFSFDVAMEEIISTMINGACLFIPEKEEILDKHKFRAFIKRNRINIAQFVPVTLREFLADTDKIDTLNIVITAGEALDEHLKEQILQKGYTLYNNYGPSETTVDVLSTQCTDQKVTIGKPISNTQCFILDKRLNPLPVGVPGELYVGGDGLARGYLGRPELTAEKFIPDPFCDDPNARLYRTGDLVRYLSDGNIEFLGRVDYQMKIRGFRIEPGEIEEAIRQQPHIRETVVIAREDQPGIKRLVAYVVLHRKSSLSMNGLRSFLKEKLPNYMVPSAFVVLDSLPLMPNGKVDRKSLPAADVGRPDLEGSFVTPRTPLEETLAGIWCEILGLKEVGINDDFFELGGHSLLATQVMSRVKNALHVEIPLRRLFETPTIAGLADEIGKNFSAGERHLAPIAPASREGGLPLSFAQERMWFFDQLKPGSSTYNMRLTLRLTGDINMGSLEQSLSEILRRHEVLRTTFVTQNDQPVQVVASPGAFPLPCIDLSTLPEEQREAKARELASEEASRPFDLATGPLLRAVLLQLNLHDHVLLVTMHHIVSDGWSMGIFYRELSALYEAFSKGKQSPLAELPIQYADFAVWQRQWLQGKRLEEQLAFWKKQLAGNLPILELPTDYSRSAVQTHRGGHCSLQLSRELMSSLNALSQRKGVTLFMMMLAAFMILLHRLSAQDDIIVGTPIAGRNCSETEGLIGVFLNTLVMRTDFSGNPSFCSILDRIRKTALDAYVHQDLPFEKLVEALRPERNLSSTPLFQAMLNMLNLSYNAIEPSELREDMIEMDSKFDLTLYVSLNDDRMLLDLVYNADLFEGLRMMEMLEQMKYLLEQIVEDPEKSIGLYSLRTHRSAAFLPDPTAVVPEPYYPPVIDMFLSHVDRSPSHPAVSQNGVTWTYRQLSESVYHLSGVLRSYGIAKGEVVAVTGARSFGIVSCMAAVLMSGGVLLTIDQNLPDSRKILMCQEAQAKCLLHIGDRQGASHWCDEIFPSRIVSVDKDKGLTFNSEKSLDLSQIDLPELSPDDAAYIFFTSGTTGVPKGVLGRHKGLSHFLVWQRDTFAVGASDRCAQLTNLSFDVVLRDIFLPLVSGATLYLPDESEGPVSDRVLSWLDRERITLLHAVPSVSQSWLDSIPPGITLGSLRNVFFAGEPLRESFLRKWSHAFPSLGKIVNLYGPTETTLAKCFYVLPSEIRAGIQPIGWPLPETQALILAENGQLCGIGEIGEIVLRTPFRTLGYVNNFQEQQKRFLRNHFRDDSNDVVYYTGDLGRYRPDGSLTILGRIDDQVKIRGIRIEPDEITTILERHPYVRSAVVTAWENSHEEYILVAYIVSSGQGKITVSELRSHLSKQLPNYMIPSVFVELYSLPLTPNGKVDRKSLPAPESERPEMKDSYSAPRTPIEELLTEIWCEVLGVKKAGVHDNFFELGGHSLLATQVISRLRNVLQMETPLRFLFEAPTPAGLATRIAQRQAEISDPEELTRILVELEGSASDTVSEFRETENERYE